MKLKVEVKGVKNMRRRVGQTHASLIRKGIDAVGKEANAVMRIAKRMAPKEDGDLRGSGTVGPVYHNLGLSFAVRLSFGDSGPSSLYAHVLHEWPSKHDPPNWIGHQINFSEPGTGPKYLEIPLHNAMAGMDARIAQRCHL